MTARERADEIIEWMKTGPHELPKTPRYIIESAILAHAEAMRERTVCWAIEYILRQMVPDSDWPISSNMGFPGIKVQALLDAQNALPIE